MPEGLLDSTIMPPDLFHRSLPEGAVIVEQANEGFGK
jgi:hypothetical protein